MPASERQFPCKSCGAGLEFDPRAASLACRYCGAETPLPQSEDEVEELDFHAHLEKALAEEETEERRVVKCGGCAAEVTLEAHVTAQDCPFCGTSIVATRESRKALKPRALLPFAIRRAQAFGRFEEWLRGLWFAPSGLVRQASTESALTGIYVPYWTYDCDAISFYRGERGDDYWATETFTAVENGRTVTRTRQVRRTRWWPVSGTVWNPFDDVLVLASRSLPRKITERLEPWDLENLVPYQDGYLSGFQAESYQVGLPEGFERAKELMEREIRETVRRDIGGDHQRIHALRSRYDRVRFKHVLLPLWINAYRHGERVYRFVVNGRTGEVQGERPWSWAKIALLVLGVLAAVGGAAAALRLL